MPNEARALLRLSGLADKTSRAIDQRVDRLELLVPRDLLRSLPFLGFEDNEVLKEIEEIGLILSASSIRIVGWHRQIGEGKPDRPLR